MVPDEGSDVPCLFLLPRLTLRKEMLVAGEVVGLTPAPRRDPIRAAAMGYRDDLHDQSLILDGVHDAVVADAELPAAALVAGHRLASGRAGIGRQGAQVLQGQFTGLAGQAQEVLAGRRQEEDLVTHGRRSDSRATSLRGMRGWPADSASA